ncbi:cyclase/dehydrase family protein [Pyronema domesticum]|uniref:Similar to Coenzyme Q-binding protein coq10, mitochondrial acc. no. Q9USM9 n=1 Tax=Pyronema omphalodes (strain CBS 100304) TaxID=1076935 RepID=U4L9E5_PYROM|nr:cyclase/dehydrase family protein [Pyronema domesticum]CCX13701.1 Similar to Coenzyme Q-binding protein coq10, mitochondrial; acc. no. Q9USM9 [Pyronema omphalodes CBS 100304]
MSVRALVPRPCVARTLRRTFFDLPTPGAIQRFSATRHLPYDVKPLYSLIADIDSYRHFLPYCVGSHITKRDPTTNDPTEADLRVGWGNFDETFRSRVRCEPGTNCVEATSESPLFTKLKARWEIEKKEQGADVRLNVEVAFNNPLYAAASGAVAPKLAQIMVEAFEKRAGDVLGKK